MPPKRLTPPSLDRRKLKELNKAVQSNKKMREGKSPDVAAVNKLLNSISHEISDLDKERSRIHGRFVELASEIVCVTASLFGPESTLKLQQLIKTEMKKFPIDSIGLPDPDEARGLARVIGKLADGWVGADRMAKAEKQVESINAQIAEATRLVTDPFDD